MNKIKLFLSIIVIAIFSAFSVSAQSEALTAPPEIVAATPSQAEKITAGVPSPSDANLVRTRDVVIYGIFVKAPELPRTGWAILIIKEKFKPLPAADSKFFPPRLTILRQRQHVYV